MNQPFIISLESNDNSPVPDARILFFEDEWQGKRHICNSIVRAKNNQITLKLAARRCNFLPLSAQEARDHFNRNHIAGYVPGQFHWGLQYDREIVSAISFRKPFTNQDPGTIEIARFCSEVDMMVVGGLSKLICNATPILLENNFTRILTYADLRFGTGSSYQQVGFQLTGKTQKDYFYTDGVQRFHRFKYRAQPGKSEKQVAREANVHKVYGRGSNKYIKELGPGNK